MKKFYIILAITLMVGFVSPTLATPILIMLPIPEFTVMFEDGGSHIINDDVYQSDWVYLDYSYSGGLGSGLYIDPDINPGTHINLIDGSSVGNLVAWDYATVTMTGGSVASHLYTGNDGTITMTGGSVGGHLVAWDNAAITMTGGSVGGHLMAWVDATIYLDGTGFQITDLDGNITSLSYGDKLTDFASFYDGMGLDYYTGTITGTLADGSALNDVFYINNIGMYAGTADIIIIPEPCSLVLLGLGSLVLGRI